MDKTKHFISKLGEEKKDGSSISLGVPYQNIPRLSISGHRSFSDGRARLIMERVDMTDKTVADLGCSVGTMSAEFGKKAASVVGYDHDEIAIKVATSLYNSNVHFETSALTLEFLDAMPPVDVVVWTSQFMWMVKQHGFDYALDFLWKLSTKCKTLVFETAGKDDGSAPLDLFQEDVIELLIKNTIFQKVVDHGPWNDGWFPRNMFVCSEPMTAHDGEWSNVKLPSRRIVVKEFKKKQFSLELREREARFLRTLNGDPHFPKFHGEDGDSLYMEYAGPRAAWLPEGDIKAICLALHNRGIVHRDIRPENVLWNGNNVVLVDFSFATMGKEITNYHYDLGGKYKCPYGFNDEYSLRKIQAELIKGR